MFGAGTTSYATTAGFASLSRVDVTKRLRITGAGREGIAAGVKQSPTGFTCVHFFSEKALAPGDRMVPLIACTNPLNGKQAVAACAYLLDGDMKGRVVVCGIMRGGGRARLRDALLQNDAGRIWLDAVPGGPC